MIGPAAAAAASSRRLLTPIGATDIGSATVPPLSTTCRRWNVQVQGLPDLQATVAVSDVPTAQQAILICFSGGDGTTYWHQNIASAGFFVSLVAGGVKVYSVAWASNWMTAPLGKRYGTHRTAARPAALINALRAANPGSKVLLLGGSNGTTQVSAYLAYYGGTRTVERAFFVAGPMMALQRLCSGLPEDLDVSAVGSDVADKEDSAHGYAAGTGPCYLGAGTSMRTRYLEESPDTSRFADLRWDRMPLKPFHVRGATDNTNIARTAWDWLATRPRSSYSMRRVLNVGHNVQNDDPGEKAIRYAVQQVTNPYQQSPGAPSSTGEVSSVTDALPFPVQPGSLLVAHFLATTTAGNLVIPAGWTPVTALSTIGVRTMGVYTRVATGLETTATFTFGATSPVLMSVRFMEIGTSTNAGTVLVDQVTSGGATGTGTGPVTSPALTVAPQSAYVFLGFASAGPGALGSWSGGFDLRYATAANPVIAAGFLVRPGESLAAFSGGVSWSNNVTWGAIMLTAKNGPAEPPAPPPAAAFPSPARFPSGTTYPMEG